ncbi:MAG: hypothetical protein AAB557_04950 [Patescibacteria group bacterium]
MTTCVDGNEYDVTGTKLIPVKSVLEAGTETEEEKFILAPSVLQGYATITDGDDGTHWLVAGEAVRVTRMKRGDDHQEEEEARQGTISEGEVLYFFGEGNAQLSVARI